MDKSIILSISFITIIAFLNSICYSQMEIVINGNVVIEQINNNENVATSATTPISSPMTSAKTNSSEKTTSNFLILLKLTEK